MFRGLYAFTLKAGGMKKNNSSDTCVFSTETSDKSDLSQKRDASGGFFFVFADSLLVYTVSAI